MDSRKSKESRPRAFRLKRAVCGPEVSAGRASGPGAGGLWTLDSESSAILKSRDRICGGRFHACRGGSEKGPPGVTHAAGHPSSKPLSSNPPTPQQNAPDPETKNRNEEPEPRTGTPPTLTPRNPQHSEHERIGKARTGAVYPESALSERTRLLISRLSSPPAGHSNETGAKDNPGGCVLTHLQETQTEQVYLNSLVLLGSRGWFVVPTSARKGLKSVVVKEADRKLERSEPDFGERWGERSRLTIVSEEFRVGSAKSHPERACGAFSRKPRRAKKLATTDKSVQELRRLVIRMRVDAACREGPARGN